ncbi:MAG: polysaccharide pyruvyl transferase family protein [Acidobacteriota bacterium]|nr:polysaccharide pyruvyl transferase family protein [Acidobacteriota bacterium]
MQIALWNSSGLNNIGDRLIDEVTRSQIALRLPSANFRTYSPWPNPANRTELLLIDRDGRWSEEGSADAIVIGGGAVLIGPPFRHPGLQTFFLGASPALFKDTCPIIWNAVCSDTEFQAALYPTYAAYVCNAAKRVNWRTVRNKRTLEHLRNCGVPGNVTVVPDPVVLLKKPDKKRESGRGLSSVGVIVARSEFPKSFIQEMVETAKLHEQCCSDELYRPFIASGQIDSSEDANTWAQAIFHVRKTRSVEIAGFENMYDDHLLAASVARRIAEEPRIFTNSHAQEAIEWMRSKDCIVAGRLHHCILALVAGSVPIAIDMNFDPICETSKLKEFADASLSPSSYIDWQHLTAQTDRLSNHIEGCVQWASLVADSHSDLYRAANEHFDQLAEILVG